MTAIIIIVIVLVAAGVGVGIFVASSKQKKPKGYKQVKREPVVKVEATEVIKTKLDETALKNWLDKVDEVYIQAFQFKQLGPFAKYASPSLCSKVQQNINYHNTKLFGTAKYRIRKWDIVSVNAENVLVRKELTFKKIKFGATEVPMGDKCIEFWQVETLAKGKYRVTAIQDTA